MDVYFRGYPDTGPFIVMFYLMLKTDLLRFAIIWGIFIVQFSSGNYSPDLKWF